MVSFGGKGRYPEVTMVVSTQAVASQITQRYIDKTPTSAQHHERALATFPSGVTHHGRFLKPHPLYIDHASGSHKWDVDGNEYVDYFGGHGALILGHAHPAVVEAVTRQVPRGTHYGAQHAMELEWAELIKEMVPSAEKLRFVSSGTEATHLALRLARAHTGKTKLVRFGTHFHGWHDYVAFSAPAPEVNKPAGIPGSVVGEVIPVAPNDLDTVRSIFESRDDVAAVILEPTGAGFGHIPTSGEVLKQLRELAGKHGVVLIFDEVVTGFRVSPGGAQEYYGVTPDLTALAKIVAGGYPGAAVVGRADILGIMDWIETDAGIEQPMLPHQGTFNGYPVAAVAGITTLKLLRADDYIGRANRTAAAIRDGMNEIIGRLGAPWCAYGEFSGVHVFTNPDRDTVSRERILDGTIHWQKLAKGTPPELGHKIRQGMIIGGVDVTGWPGGVVSGVHTEDDVEITLKAFEQTLKMMAEEGDLD